MTARLPVVGGDAGNWGTILNTFLSVSHFTDGTLNSGVVGSSQLQSSAVGATQANLPSLAGGMLLSGTFASMPTAASSNSGFFYIATDINGGTLYRSSGSAWTQIAAGSTQAPTGSVSGGDLTGTYPGPTIAKIQGTVISGTPTSGAAIVASSGTAAAWTAIPSTGTNTFTGNQTAPALIASGLTGATAASRYVGATASGAPTTGTFVVGDHVIDQTGKIWVCTIAGSPGTWTQTGGGVTTFNTRSGAVVPASGDYTAAQVTNAADKSSASTQTFTGNVQAPALIAAGLTGATSASRYVGATATVAPTTGTFAVGDFVISQNGKLWVCTVAGSPGTWVQNTVGSVTSVTAADTSVVIGGTATAPTVATNTLDVIATDHPAAANWSNNAKKITNIANGTVSTDAAAFGQLPVAATSSTAGIVKFDATAADILALGPSAVAGGNGLAADSGHVHPTTGLALLAGAAFTGNVSTTGTLAGSKSITAGVVALTDGTTISVDTSQGSHFRVVIAGNRTLANPTNPTDGQKVTFEIIQDATGSRTLSYGTAYAFSTDIPQPTLTTTPNKRDILGFVYNASTSLWYLLAVVHGF